MKATFKEACAGVVVVGTLAMAAVYGEMTEHHHRGNSTFFFVDGRPIVPAGSTGLQSTKPQAHLLQKDASPVAATPSDHPSQKKNGGEILGQALIGLYFGYIAAGIGREEFKRRKSLGGNSPSP